MGSTTIVIVLDLNGDCPTGTAAVVGSRPRAFHGWLALASAIEALTRTNETRKPEHEGERT